MGKKSGSKLIFDDNIDNLSQEIERGSKANTLANTDTKSKGSLKNNQQSSTAPISTSVSALSLREKRNLNRKEKDKSDLWKRDKNPLYDMECCINQKYIKDGELASAQVFKEFILPFKEYALKKKTGIRDLFNIAIFQFGVKEGILKQGEEKS
ncbi:MAG: hypothetical protein ACYDCN_01035 [Bacteroidia bacterium]